MQKSRSNESLVVILSAIFKALRNRVLRLRSIPWDCTAFRSGCDSAEFTGLYLAHNQASVQVVTLAV